MIRTVTATRYVMPFRQGGSVPALVEADDESLYVLKFSAAGQGPKALIAELVAGEIGRALGLRVPELVFIIVEPGLAAAEPHPEIREPMNASVGLNLGLRFLPYALEYNPILAPRPSPYYKPVNTVQSNHNFGNRFAGLTKNTYAHDPSELP